MPFLRVDIFIWNLNAILKNDFFKIHSENKKVMSLTMCLPTILVGWNKNHRKTK